jgi:hypothetical protein
VYDKLEAPINNFDVV